MSDRPENWEEVVRRGKTATEGALFKLATDAISWLEKWQRPKEAPYRGNFLTEEEYNAMLERQGGVCAICKEKPKAGRLAVDHIHGSRKVRGLLCSLCNSGLGLFKDDPDRLAAAIQYLKRSRTSARRLGQAQSTKSKSLGLGDAYLQGKNRPQTAGAGEVRD